MLYLDSKEQTMAKIIQYVSKPAGRDQVIRSFGVFTAIGGALVSTIILVATMLR